VAMMLILIDDDGVVNVVITILIGGDSYAS
jgi:hypothetical protein